MPKSTSEKHTEKIALKIAQKIKNGGTICLFGDLGTGKTTFVKGIAEALGIEKFAIKSPTYTYIRKLPIGKRRNLYHIDLYRLEEIDELLLHEINELFENPANIIIIEWADKLGHQLPDNRIDIKFEYIDLNTRNITLPKTD